MRLLTGFWIPRVVTTGLIGFNFRRLDTQRDSHATGQEICSCVMTIVCVTCSSWAALVVGRSVPQHARSAACVALDVGVFVLAAVGLLGTWQDRASISDPECTDVNGYVATQFRVSVL